MEQTEISKIRPYPRNAKEHKDRQIKKIADSIREFGFNQPIVLDKEGVIIVGHGRYFAARQLGMDTVPTLTLDLSEEKAKAYRLADNKLNESNWDMDIVIEELKTLSLEMIDLTGFSGDLTITPEKDDDEIPAIPKKPKTEAGDLYQLGGYVECPKCGKNLR